MRRNIEILTNPIILSLILGSVLIIFLPDYFNKYRLKLLEVSTSLAKRITYCDLDNDGNSEKLEFSNPKGRAATILIRKNNKILEQWNFQGDYINGDFYSLFDYNNDNNIDISLITFKNDSIFIHLISPFNKENREPFENLFICSSFKYDEKMDVNATVIKTTDINNDGFLELLFVLNTGIPCQPRRLYAIDLTNGEIIKSPKSGFVLDEPTCSDINNDGRDEYIFSTAAYRNCTKFSDVIFKDTCCWLTVFDKNLTYLFTPIPIGQYKTKIKVRPMENNGQIELCVLKVHVGVEGETNALLLFNGVGDLLKQKIIEKIEHTESYYLLNCVINNRNEVLMHTTGGMFNKIDQQLNIIPYRKIDNINVMQPIRFDADDDGVDEFIFPGKDLNKWYITRNDLSYPVEFDALSSEWAWPKSSLIKRKGQEPVLFIHLGNKLLKFKYEKNPLYYLKYTFYLGTYLILFLLFYALQKVQNHRAKRKYETEKQIVELQLISAKNQMSPHFTLNLMQSIASLFDKKDRDKAMDIFAKYTKILRNTLINSDQILVTLEEELDYVVNYLELEKFRFNDKFKYEITISDSIDQEILIPKMLIHTFVENAIKHGLKHRESNGLIEIVLNADTKNYSVEITDNGVGREKAKEYVKFSTGMGLKIIDSILEYYRKEHKINITYKVNDLFDNFNQPKGTKVIINIPLKKT